MVQIAGNVARERLLALTVGAVLTFGVAEVGLRLLGPLFAVQRSEGEAKYTLLCEGDSFTYGIGGNAYPDQLQKLMNERHGEGTVRTVNTGIPGLNSALLADDLEAHLIEHKPDAVLVIVGENNSWNSIRLDDSGGAPSVWMRVDAMLLSSRAYKLVRVAAIGWYYGTFHEARGVDHGFEGDDLELQRAANHLTDTREVIGYPEKEPAPRLPLEAVMPAWDAAQVAKREGRYDDALREFLVVVEGAPDFGPAWYGLATAYMRRKENGPAIAALEKAASLPPVDGEVYFTLGHAYAQEEREADAVRAWTDGLRQWPESHKLYGALARYFQEQHRLWEAIDAVKDVPGVEKNLLHRYLLTLKPHAPTEPKEGEEDAVKGLVMEGLRNDIRRVIRTSRRYGAEVILGSYPDAAYDVVEEVAREERVKYIDFRPIYDARFESREQYLSADRCHCNTDGYAVMAEVFADAVEEALGIR
jgi:lysophospholipase L1-like esterase